MSGAPDRELEGLIEVFRVESAENLTTMEQSLLALERGGNADPELLRAVFRAAHTLKGNSATVGYDALAAAAHELEDLLERVRNGSVPFTRDLVTSLLESVDALRALLSGADRAAATETPGPDAAQAADGTLRVNVGRLDTLLDLTAEIIIARSRLGQLLGSTAGDSIVSGTLWHLEQLHASLQEEVMRLRMVPLGPGFRIHHRTVRDLAGKQGKQIRLVIEGDDVEVDTSIAEQLRDPLTHMIRNAVDHGLETPEARRAAGKPETGTITLRATHVAGAVLIELSDDGRGLDRERIAAKAVASGLADTTGWSDERVFGLIFEAGFSTAAEVTAVSGRGVGMDVVRRHIRSLRGTIEISSVPGKGTHFAIRLPLTVAIINGFAVGSGSESYVLPLEAVEECVDCGAVAAGAGLYNLRGAAVPYARLADVLGLTNGAASSRRASLVVVRHGDQRVGLVVDRLDGDCQAVIKPLSGALQQVAGVAGSTILGNGRVALILDVGQLVELITEDGASRRAA